MEKGKQIPCRSQEDSKFNGNAETELQAVVKVYSFKRFQNTQTLNILLLHFKICWVSSLNIQVVVFEFSKYHSI